MSNGWDWEVGRRELADLADIRERFEGVHEPVVSEDGETVAIPVKVEDEVFTVCVNGKAWEKTFEKAWHLAFDPEGRLTALVMSDDEWTVAVDGEPWEETFDFVWNTQFSGDGKHIAVQTKAGPSYGIAVDGEPRGDSFIALRDFAISHDGQRIAATVQTVPLKEGDIFTFAQGTWSLAIDGKACERKYLNIYSPRFSADGQKVAAQVRTAPFAYTVSIDDEPWKQGFGCTWEPVFRGGSGAVMVPVLKDGWTLAENGSPIWDGRYIQLWRVASSPDGKRVAAVVARKLGQWTVAVDDQPWEATFSDVVLDPHFGPEGRIAAIVRHDGTWSMAVDGKAWGQTFDMVWDPVFDASGKRVACKVEKRGRFTVALDGRTWSRSFDALWSPVFSPDGSKMLIRAVEDGKVVRLVVHTEDLG